MRNKILFILAACFILMVQTVHAQDMPCPDAMPSKAIMDKKANMVDTLELKEFCDIFDEDQSYLTIENLYKALDKYEMKFKKIVMAQAHQQGDAHSQWAIMVFLVKNSKPLLLTRLIKSSP